MIKKNCFFVCLLLFVFLVIVCCSKKSDAEDAQETAIANMLKKYGDTCFVDTLGIYLYVVEEGTENYKNGDIVKITYAGQTLTNTVTFATNETVEVVYGNNSLVEGWNIALQLLKRNSSGYLIIPFEKGYGKNSLGVVAAYSPLFYSFVVE